MVDVQAAEDFPVCETCGSDLDWADCWYCQGEGGFHDCGEDTCCCLDGDEITVCCSECRGKGGFLICPVAQEHPHRPRPEQTAEEGPAHG